MEALDRRLEGAVRMPVDLLVQLAHEGELGGGDLYDADAVNLGPEGLGLRSSILPDVGQRLRCRFELPDDGGVCETDARVVWASDTGTHHGEFGVKFDALEPRVQAVVDRWVSTFDGSTPRVITPVSTASPEPRRTAPVASSKARSALVHLDGVGTSIEGLVTSDDGHRIEVAQPLPFLALGKGATLEVAGDTDRRALSHVALEVEGGVPRLVLTLEKMERAVSARATTKSAPPDLRAPDATLTEDDAVAPPIEEPVVAKAAPRVAPAPEPSEWVTGEASETPSSIETGASIEEGPVRASRDLSRLREREPVRAVRVSEDERAEDDAESGEKQPGLGERITPVLVKMVAGMRSAWAITIATTGPWARRAASWLVETAKAVASYVRDHAPDRIGSLLGRAPRRRTTAPPPAAAPGLRRARPSEAPAPAPSPLRGKGRIALAGVLAVAAVGLTAYALSGPAEAEPIAIETPAPIAASETEVASVPSTPAEPSTLMPPPVTEATPAETGAEIPMPPAEDAPVGGHLPAPTFPTLGAGAATHASATEAPEASSDAPIASAPSSSFGADEVANGRTSTLRMSQPVTSLVGQADESGFTVTIDGALSLDRAGPIAAANPSVERASILNRGDHCVLTVRFVAGHAPPYRVAIHGQAVEVTIGR
ncbi:MAG: PilZ domain-containing protein [Sandaracinus sp.]